MAVQFYAQIYRKLFLYKKKKKVAFIKKKPHTHTKSHGCLKKQ